MNIASAIKLKKNQKTVNARTNLLWMIILAAWRVSLKRLVEISQEGTTHLKLTAVKSNSCICSRHKTHRCLDSSKALKRCTTNWTPTQEASGKAPLTEHTWKEAKRNLIWDSSSTNVLPNKLSWKTTLSGRKKKSNLKSDKWAKPNTFLCIPSVHCKYMSLPHMGGEYFNSLGREELKKKKKWSIHSTLLYQNCVHPAHRWGTNVRCPLQGRAWEGTFRKQRDLRVHWWDHHGRKPQQRDRRSPGEPTFPRKSRTTLTVLQLHQSFPCVIEPQNHESRATCPEHTSCQQRGSTVFRPNTNVKFSMSCLQKMVAVHCLTTWLRQNILARAVSLAQSFVCFVSHSYPPFAKHSNLHKWNYFLWWVCRI